MKKKLDTQLKPVERICNYASYFSLVFDTPYSDYHQVGDKLFAKNDEFIISMTSSDRKRMDILSYYIQTQEIIGDIFNTGIHAQIEK